MKWIDQIVLEKSNRKLFSDCLRCHIERENTIVKKWKSKITLRPKKKKIHHKGFWNNYWKKLSSIFKKIDFLTMYFIYFIVLQTTTKAHKAKTELSYIILFEHAS